MNKKFWRILTAAGFVLGVLAVIMILVSRFGFLNRFVGSFFEAGQQISGSSEESLLNPTQEASQEAENFALNADKMNLDRLQQACLGGNDCIPSIDNPQFVSVQRAKFMNDSDLVVGIEFANSKKIVDSKAYPVKILNWHEAVNDNAAGKPLVITYSALSMTPRVFESLIDGKTVEFGVSDKVLNSDPVLYDRETKSLWNQFDGSALAGQQRGRALALYPSQLVKWSDWVKLHPKTLVLSEDTGFDFQYDEFPYQDYEQSPTVYFPVENSDNRRQPKDLVFGIVVDGHQKAYPELELQKALPQGGSLTDNFGGRKLQITFDNGEFNLVDLQTGQPLPVYPSYYFIWEAFYPDTDIFQFSQG
jgi:hypothetical protein